MTEPHHRIINLAVHKLIKEPGNSAQIELRPNVLKITPSTQRLVDHLGKLYNERLGKGFGHFEEDEDNFPMPRFIRQHVIDNSIDFITLSHLMMQHLQSRSEHEELASGGHVLITRVENNRSDYLFVAIVSEIVGTAITSDLEVIDSIHLDINNLRVAGRIDLNAWRSGAERYISFLKGRANVAQYFKLFLGCNDLIIALRETQKLVQGLEQFAEAQQLSPSERDQFFERAHGYLDDAGNSDSLVSLDTLSQQVFPESADNLRDTLTNKNLSLATEFIPDRRAIKPLIRFKSNGPEWKLEFDRNSLRSGSVIYDKQHDRIILTNIPEHLKKELLGAQQS